MCLPQLTGVDLLADTISSRYTDFIDRAEPIPYKHITLERPPLTVLHIAASGVVEGNWVLYQLRLLVMRLGFDHLDPRPLDFAQSTSPPGTVLLSW